MPRTSESTPTSTRGGFEPFPLGDPGLLVDTPTPSSTPERQPSTGTPHTRELFPLGAVRNVATRIGRRWEPDIYLRQRAAILGKDVREMDVPFLSERLGQIAQILNPSERRAFLRNEYTMAELENVLKLEPGKVALAVQTKTDVETLVDDRHLEPEFAPAMSLGSYVAVEFMRDYGLSNLQPKTALAMLKRMKEHTDSDLRGRRALISNLERYLTQLNVDSPRVSGHKMEAQLREMIALDLHGKLAKRADEMSFLGQSQGVEIEVLKHITYSKLAKERGVDRKRWLPRGIEADQHERTDWALLPLLGLQEDLGERDYQTFEMSFDPTSSSAAQTVLIEELILGGFITEKELSEVDEGYSVHVSTVFPNEIVSKESLAEYRQMARALAGAFASDQRISFGGFASGGAEISDKTTAGTLKDVDKKGKKTSVRGKALIEIRNLDITPTGQFSAILAKEVMDFGFRSYWEGKKGLPQAGIVGKFAGERWGDFMGKLTGIFEQYGIDPSGLDTESGWKALAQARDRHPELKDELAGLIRGYTASVRRFKRSYERLNPEVDGEPQTHKVLAEPLGKRDDRMYLGEDMRHLAGIGLGEELTIRFGDLSAKVKTARSKVREDGHIEDSLGRWRFSKNVIDSLGLSGIKDYHVVYDSTNSELIVVPGKAQPIFEL